MESNVEPDVNSIVQCQDLKKMLRDKPLDPQLRIVLGDQLMKAGKIKEAQQQYEQALDLDPENAAAAVRLGDLFLSNGGVVEADSYYYQALEYASTNRQYIARLAETTALKGEYQLAEILYQMATDCRP